MTCCDCLYGYSCSRKTEVSVVKANGKDSVHDDSVDTSQSSQDRPSSSGTAITQHSAA